MDLHKEIEKVHYNIKAGHFQNALKKCNALSSRGRNRPQGRFKGLNFKKIVSP